MSVNSCFCAILIGKMKALEFMKTHVVVTTPESTLANAVDLMDLYQATVLPVVDASGLLCGVVTEADVFATLQATLKQPSIVARDAETPCELSSRSLASVTTSEVETVRGRLVQDIMSSDATAVREDQNLSEILPMFIEGNVAYAFVLDQAGRVVGRLSRSDMMQALFEDGLVPGALN